MNSNPKTNHIHIAASGPRMADRPAALGLFRFRSSIGAGSVPESFGAHRTFDECGWAIQTQGLAEMLWKEVPGFPEYEVSEHGDLRRGLKYLKPERTQGNGRKRFGLYVKGRMYRFKAAQLVALAFIGPKPFKLAEVCHNDGFEHNNHYSNLRWDTQLSNAADKVKHKLQLDEHSGFPIPAHRRLSAASTAFLAKRPRPNHRPRSRSQSL